ncbi:hypothetical protein SAMN05216316_2278 [Nitrosovibrio sp. Nv6]|nr:hypothetical protein SAMN05216316_2278 [Nitrosovibrio sp. Nv6]
MLEEYSNYECQNGPDELDDELSSPIFLFPYTVRKVPNNPLMPPLADHIYGINPLRFTGHLVI